MDDFLRLYAKEQGLIPNDVVGMVVEGELSPMRAWREHLGLTQAEVALRLGITQSAFAQLETSANSRKSTLRRVARVLGISMEQLDF